MPRGRRLRDQGWFSMEQGQLWGHLAAALRACGEVIEQDDKPCMDRR